MQVRVREFVFCNYLTPQQCSRKAGDMRSLLFLVLVLALALRACLGFVAPRAPSQPSGSRSSSAPPIEQTDVSSTRSRVQRLDRQLAQLYQSALSIKCPFFRRKSYDVLDTASSVFRFVVARHKSLDFPLLEQLGCRDDYQGTADLKTTGLTVSEIATVILTDWKTSDGRGYYITGRLSRQIYSDHCFFDGPDPDMPVRGLKKYLAAASQLFEYKSSRAELLSLQTDVENRVLTARWRLSGKLNLPWHPHVKPWTGTTRYIIGQDGLIERHEEEWDIPVLDAFLSTLFPALGIGAPPAPPVLSPGPEHLRP